MKTALINASPKNKNSASELFLNMLKPLLEPECTVIEYAFVNHKLLAQDMESMSDCDALVFAFPLYVDGIPSHLLKQLRQLECYFLQREEPKPYIYAIVNCGFYEGEHNELAIEMIKCWCTHAKLKFGTGIGVGAGPMLAMLQNVPLGKGPKKDLKKVYDRLVYDIKNKKSSNNQYVSPNFPRFAYKWATELGFRQMIKKNGLKREDINTKW